MFALCLLALCICASFGEVTFDQGYHIVVGIHRDVTEDPEIINQLQNALTSASTYLHKTTRYNMYIEKVTIVVPETWESKPGLKPSSLTFREADIRVDGPHPSMADTPYTFQPGLCGEKGRYIHLTPDFVLDKGQNRDFYYGDFGRLLVHEFAHLRYGVFDEYVSYGSSDHPIGYVVNETDIKPTACSKDIRGRFLNMITDRECIPDTLGEKLFADDCAFIVNRENNNATSSVMFAQYVKEIEDFCETNPTDPKLKHNADAPNKHNKMCNNSGTWDIISEHVDFKWSSSNRSQDTSPVFDLVQHRTEEVNDTQVCGRRIVLVLDLSGSMKDNNRYFKLRQMADRIIRDILPVGTEVGIVVFSNSARVWAEMTNLKTENDRQTLAESLPLIDDFEGLTAIGQGLLRAVDLLEKNGKTSAKARLFLVTDGEENIFPYVKSMLTDIYKKNITVHTLAYSNAAAVVLLHLSSMTGGHYSYYDESETSTQMDSLQSLQTDLTICEERGKSVEVDRTATVLNATTTSFERNITIDSTIGNNTLFVFTLSYGATTKVSLQDPDGTVYDDSSPYYEKDIDLNIIRFRFPETQPGIWTYTLTRGSSNESVVCVVTSHPRTDFTLPYEVESWLGKNSFNFESDQAGLGIFSYVHQGYNPIVHVNVTVVITSETTRTEKVLRDDGILPDNTAMDGVYTSYVTGFLSNTRHSLEVTVTSTNSTAIVRSGAPPGRAPVIYPNQTTPIVHEPVEPFTRTSSAGAVDVEGFVENVDQIDPSRVTDLEVIISDRGNRHVTLNWTAPGDDLNEGTVDRYDLRIAESFEDLRQNFSDSYKLLESDITKGSDTPVPAGSQQSMTVSLPGHLDGDSYVFGLKAIDESNRSSDLSNLKAVTFARIVVPGSSPPPSIPETSPDPSVSTPPPSLPETTPDPSVSTPPPSLPETTPDPPKASLPIIIIVVSVCFVVLVLVAIIVSCLVCRLCKKHPKSDPNRI